MKDIVGKDLYEIWLLSEIQEIDKRIPDTGGDADIEIYSGRLGVLLYESLALKMKLEKIPVKIK